MGRRRKDIVKKVKGSPYWHYTWTIQGHRIRGSCETEDYDLACTISLTKRDEHFRAVKLGILPSHEPVDLTLGQGMGKTWLDRWRHQAAAGKNQALASDILRIMGKETLLANIDDDAVRTFVAARRGERIGQNRAQPFKNTQRLVSPSTVNDTLVCLATCLNEARRWKFDGHPVRVGYANPRAHFLPVKRQRYTPIPSGRVDAFIEALVPHARTPCEMALYTGLRRTNVLALEWENIDLGSHPHITLMVKGGKRHTVWLLPEAIEVLEAYEPDQTRRSGHVFRFGQVECSCSSCLSEDKQGLRILSIRRSVKTAGKAIGLPALTFHDLRHDVGRRITRDHGLKAAQQILGHANISTTSEFYSDQEGPVLAQAMADSLSRKSGIRQTGKMKEVG